MEDTDLLKIVADEKKRSIGFDLDQELSDQREKALNYAKGVMEDVPAQPNRSKAVSTDVADAVEIVLPDLMEIFTGGDDVVAFRPRGEEDEEAAAQETDFLNYVFFDQNAGFLNLYTAIKSALLEKTGVLVWWWEDGEEVVEEYDDKSVVELQDAMQRGEVFDVEADDEAGTFEFKLRYQVPGRACVASIPPTDLTVAPETVSLADTSYCATRERVRAQDLIARGYDADLVERLSPYSTPDEEIDQARDRADESEESKSGGQGLMRLVEIEQHFIRLLDEESGKLKLWRIVTGNDCTVILDKEEVERVRVAAFAPYLVPHRFYGESIADKMMEIQKIKTVLWRMLLDSGYFALNQRMEVAMSQANEWTISDLLRNEPNMPVRVAQPGAVRPLTAGGLNFDTFAALEQASVMGELRSGIARNAQGINPETLHDTAKGMEKLFSAAQRRVRLIARVFAETGIKDAFLGLHAMLRKYGTATQKARLRNKWVSVDPTQWGERQDMSIEVGLGASGREAELYAMTQLLNVNRELIQLQGGTTGPFLNAQNVHKTLTRFARATGIKSPDLYFMDPADFQQPEPQPDPEQAKAQAQLQLEQSKAQANMQLKQAEAQTSAQIAAQKGQQDFELARMKLEAEMSLKREQIAAEMSLKREQLTAELALQRELEMEKIRAGILMGASIGTSEVSPGGEPG